MPTVGEVLRTERERQGRTLKEISDALNIKRQYLAASSRALSEITETAWEWTAARWWTRIRRR